MTDDLLCNVLSTDEDTHLTILFKFIHFSNGERLFTFRRSKDEKLAVLVKRMLVNFDKAFLKKKSSSTTKSSLIDLSFYQNQQLLNLENSDLKNKDFWLNGSEFHVNNYKYSVHVNLPMINQFKFPNRVLTNYLIYPHIEIINGHICQSTFTWFRRKKSMNNQTEEEPWTEVSVGFTHFVSEDEIECEFKVICLPGNGTTFGLSQEITSTNDVNQGPLDCPFVQRQQYTKRPVGLNQFRVLSYNLLADIYADSTYSQESLYPYCKKHFLSFDYRKLLILKEVIGYQADLLFFQEVDKIFFEKGIGPILDQQGFDSHFLCKQQMVEGLAIFHNRSKFKCLQDHEHTFSNLLHDCKLFSELKSKVEMNDLLLKRISKLKNSLQVVLLNSVEQKNRLLLVCNLHLYSKDDADHIRLIQAYICFKYAQNMIDTIQKDYPSHTVSLVISGDFNSTPEWGVLKLVNNKKVDASLEDFRINQQELIHDCELEHSLNLASACGFPNYTNYTTAFNGCLDYTFYDISHLKVVDTVPMPNHEDIVKYTALPNEKFPSDHLALVSTLEWIECD